MSTFRLNLVFSGVDFDDDQVFDALGGLSNIVWRSQGRYAFATALAEATSPLKAADLVTKQVTKLVPSARPIRLDDDLVSIPDIAARIGVTREAVRNWANGTRHANFPLPRGIVGDAIKVWAWADVSNWLRDNLGLGDAEDFPSASDAALINALFSRVAQRQSVATAALATWKLVAKTASASAETRTACRSQRQTTWIPATHERIELTVIEGGLHAAA